MQGGYDGAAFSKPASDPEKGPSGQIELSCYFALKNIHQNASQIVAAHLPQSSYEEFPRNSHQELFVQRIHVCCYGMMRLGVRLAPGNPGAIFFDRAIPANVRAQRQKAGSKIDIRAFISTGIMMAGLSQRDVALSNCKLANSQVRGEKCELCLIKSPSNS